MSSKDDVSIFLKDFKTKKGIWLILFRDDRGKNTQTLSDLEISSSDREKVIDALNLEDYSEGP